MLRAWNPSWINDIPDAHIWFETKPKAEAEKKETDKSFVQFFYCPLFINFLWTILVILKVKFFNAGILPQIKKKENYHFSTRKYVLYNLCSFQLQVLRMQKCTILGANFRHFSSAVKKGKKEKLVINWKQFQCIKVIFVLMMDLLLVYFREKYIGLIYWFCVQFDLVQLWYMTSFSKIDLMT